MQRKTNVRKPTTGSEVESNSESRDCMRGKCPAILHHHWRVARSALPIRHHRRHLDPIRKTLTRSCCCRLHVSQPWLGLDWAGWSPVHALSALLMEARRGSLRARDGPQRLVFENSRQVFDKYDMELTKQWMLSKLYAVLSQNGDEMKWNSGPLFWPTSAKQPLYPARCTTHSSSQRELPSTSIALRDRRCDSDDNTELTSCPRYYLRDQLLLRIFYLHSLHGFHQLFHNVVYAIYILCLLSPLIISGFIQSP